MVAAFPSSLLTSYVIYLFWSVVAQKDGLFIYLVIVLTALTSVSYFVGFVFPDIFTSLMILSMYMIIFSERDFELREHWFCITGHMFLNHIPFLEYTYSCFSFSCGGDPSTRDWHRLVGHH
jgi:hypothetical protein